MNWNPAREESLFAEVLSRPAGERAAFLNDACRGDPDLRVKLEALLAAHESPDRLLCVSHLRQGFGGQAASPREFLTEEKPGDVIGRYKLLQKIGEGGCGVVWMAEQDMPVRRRVALKVIKLGMDTKSVVARFEAERQALAMMNHPNIAKVHDAGATETGRPYFVMELVRGVPITRFCDEKLLGATDRLHLFIQVCQAVQHAHQKGIIHRDIKPSNVLVTLHDDEAVPVVIDFGIAKATNGRLTDQTLFTAFDQFIGTPVYMSPEQADYNALDVDTRTDIYSLGVLLYELLTGRPPFDPKTLTNVAIEQMRRVIREVEPPRPSARIRTLGAEERTSIARLRGTVPQRLATILRGDLDWIVMKAMEKNRTRRYETATALAADIARYLKHEPVSARPPSTAYRVFKFTRRHRFGVATAAAVTSVLVAGIVASTWQAVRATGAEHRAEAERSKAVQARNRAEGLLEFMLEDLRNEVRKVGKLDLLEMVGEKATAYFAALDPHEITDTALLQQAKTLRQIGEVQIQKARYEPARQSFALALARARSLHERNPAHGEALFERAQAEFFTALVSRRRGEAAAESEWLERYRDSAVALVQLEPEKPRWQQELVYADHNLAVLESDRGNLEAAHDRLVAKLATVEKMIAANPKDSNLHLSLATTHSFLGSVAERRGRFSEALERYRAQSAILEANLKESPLDKERSFKVAVSLSLQVEVLLITGRIAEARELLARTLAEFDALVAHDPTNRRWLLNSFAAHLRQAELDLGEDRIGVAIERMNRTRPRVEVLSASEPSDRNASVMNMTALRIEAALSLAANRADAGDLAREAANQASRIGAIPGATEKIVGECALAHVVAAVVAETFAHREAALDQARRTLELVGARQAKTNDWRLLDPAARALALLGKVEDARAIVDRLYDLGYRPLQPWPATVASESSVSSTQNKERRNTP